MWIYNLLLYQELISYLIHNTLDSGMSSASKNKHITLLQTVWAAEMRCDIMSCVEQIVVSSWGQFPRAESCDSSATNAGYPPYRKVINNRGVFFLMMLSLLNQVQSVSISISNGVEIQGIDS